MLRVTSNRTRGKLRRYQSSRDAALDLDFSTIGGYYLHLAADYITGLSDGTGITTWLDKSGNQRNATQATSGSRPLYKTGIINGLPVARFQGTDDFMTLGNIAKMPNLTVFCVWATTDVASRHWVYGSLDSGGGASNAWGTLDLGLDNDNTIHYFISTGAANSQGKAGTAVMSNNVFALTTQRYTNGQTQEEWWKNGAALTVTPSSTSASTNSGTASGYSLGRPGDLSAVYFTGDIAEFIMFNTALSDADRSRVEVYLRSKYAL